ncbi:WNT1-inducible-signaling pathway protein 1 [Chionoecetes opilio]|uniref:WNT1-inducible-signaling pathway protein 1 n=1 Tax=Chionoecetes opilio TaxID=41210 RepID=A0A8J4XZQ8_CHIOP|nr:WNT1-inducible-signaling pathway protein 1 [Chionoecetes opilio]
MTCGVGLSVRWSTDNPRCQLVNQTRLCQVRPCQDTQQQQQQLMTKKHHIRRSHQCKATLRPSRALRLRVGWCVSERRYRPKRCATCPGRCCAVFTSTTISITFLCPLHANTDLLALPRAFPDSRPLRPRPQIPPTTTLSVYDMMDEGQPVAEAVLTDPRLPRDYNEVWRGDEDDLDSEPLLEHENLTTEDDYLYDEIKSDNYETVKYQVEWIMRCKCAAACETGPSLPPPPPPALHTAPPT